MKKSFFLAAFVAVAIVACNNPKNADKVETATTEDSASVAEAHDAVVDSTKAQVEGTVDAAKEKIGEATDKGVDAVKDAAAKGADAVQEGAEKLKEEVTK